MTIYINFNTYQTKTKSSVVSKRLLVVKPIQKKIVTKTTTHRTKTNKT